MKGRMMKYIYLVIAVLAFTANIVQAMKNQERKTGLKGLFSKSKTVKTTKGSQKETQGKRNEKKEQNNLKAKNLRFPDHPTIQHWASCIPHILNLKPQIFERINTDFPNFAKSTSEYTFSTPIVRDFLHMIMKEIPWQCRDIFDRSSYNFKEDEISVFTKNKGLEYLFTELRKFMASLRSLRHLVDENYTNEWDHHVSQEEEQKEESLSGRFYRGIMESFIGLSKAYFEYEQQFKA